MTVKKFHLPTLENLEAMAAEGRANEDRIRAQGPSLNSALVWFPKLSVANLPVPKTIFVAFEPDQLWPTCDGKPAVNFPMDKLESACRTIGYPCFLRTDLASAKHYGAQAFRAESSKDLWRCVILTFEDNALKDIAWETRAFMVREWLDLDGDFTAFDGLRISREWRFFSDGKRILCHHFYWPQDAIKSSIDSCTNWRQLWHKLSKQPQDEEMIELTSLALAAASAVGQRKWSIDIAKDTTGKWWITDMAIAESSWHPEH